MMIHLSSDAIDYFVTKQSIGQVDKRMQLERIQEELTELIFASMVETEERELEEAIDVLVTVFVYLKILGITWSVVEEEFERKMIINLEKPIRKEKGVKVQKE